MLSSRSIIYDLLSYSSLVNDRHSFRSVDWLGILSIVIIVFIAIGLLTSIKSSMLLLVSFICIKIFCPLSIVPIKMRNVRFSHLTESTELGLIYVGSFSCFCESKGWYTFYERKSIWLSHHLWLWRILLSAPIVHWIISECTEHWQLICILVRLIWLLNLRELRLHRLLIICVLRLEVRILLIVCVLLIICILSSEKQLANHE